MGAHISSANLARETSRLGALGVVSGVGLRQIVITQIRLGDTNAIEVARTFPIPGYFEELLRYCPGGDHADRAIPMDVPDRVRGAIAKRLSTICSYVEVRRAKAGHLGQVGINVMWKCALTALPTIYGAMLAGVDALLCGAGVPMELPDIVRRMRTGEDLEYTPLTGTSTNVNLQIAGDNSASVLQNHPVPRLLPILSNYAFCKRLLDTWRQRYECEPSAFILENHAAGGHNAPPRDHVAFGSSDDLESYFDKVLRIGLPVYVAGDFPDGGTQSDMLEWLSRGAYGIQVGSRFALCEESGMRPDLKYEIIEQNQNDELQVDTDMRMSPTGYPLKFVRLPGTLSEPEVREAQRHVCNLGYLMHSHVDVDEAGNSKESYLCAAMPPDQLQKRGGDTADGDGRICLCNALLATAGYNHASEPVLVTLGLSGKAVKERLTAREVMESILGAEAVAKFEAQLSVK